LLQHFPHLDQNRFSSPPRKIRSIEFGYFVIFEKRILHTQEGRGVGSWGPERDGTLYVSPFMYGTLWRALLISALIKS
jgi:hypothetical protein